jgi:hypothetical protein
MASIVSGYARLADPYSTNHRSHTPSTILNFPGARVIPENR